MERQRQNDRTKAALRLVFPHWQLWPLLGVGRHVHEHVERLVPDAFPVVVPVKGGGVAFGQRDRNRDSGRGGRETAAEIKDTGSVSERVKECSKMEEKDVRGC